MKLKIVSLVIAVIFFVYPLQASGFSESPCDLEVTYTKSRGAVYSEGMVCGERGAGEGSLSLIPMTIGEGMKVPQKIPHDRRREYLQEHYGETIRYAVRCGISLSENLDAYYAAGCRHGWLYLLFFNGAQAVGCGKEYLIQRVKVESESYLEDLEQSCQTRQLYLVEAMKLDDDKTTKRGDQHLKVFSLGKAFKRRVVVECEVGWGCVPGEAVGSEWPYKRGVLYRELQEFSEERGLYDRVQFQVSRKYETMVEFDRGGACRVRLPGFLRP